MRTTTTRTCRRARAGLFAATAIAVACAALPGGLASADEPVEATASEPAAPAALATVAPVAAPSALLPDLPTTSLDLALLPVDSPEFRQAAARYGEVAVVQSSAQGQRAGIDRRSTELTARLAQLEVTATVASSRIEGLRTRLAEIDRAIAAVAVRTYVEGDGRARADAAITSETPAVSDVDQRAVLGRASMDVLIAERAAHLERIADAAARVERATAEGREVRAAVEALAEARPSAVEREQATGSVVAAERVAYEAARVLAKVEGAGFQLIALDAYHRAARRVNEERPACGLRWWGIAGVSAVEGHHGTYQGAVLTSTGDASKRIIGISLDGTNNTRAIADSDGGLLDGDPHADRAVGPMQFIPQTWSRFAADGNDDGIASPFNLYDATLAAAHYLCTASGGLEGEPGLRAAYFSYNHSEAYVDNVLGHARFYESVLRLPS